MSCTASANVCERVCFLGAELLVEKQLALRSVLCPCALGEQRLVPGAAGRLASALLLALAVLEPVT